MKVIKVAITRNSDVYEELSKKDAELLNIKKVTDEWGYPDEEYWLDVTDIKEIGEAETALKEKIKNKIKQLEEEKEDLEDSDTWIEHKQKLGFAIDIKLEVLEEILGESEV